MIESNLSVLLAERGLKITTVSKDTGISRTTLTALCNDYSGGIKFDTLDTLCEYLDIEPKDFFNYTPYRYEFSVIQYKRDDTERYLHYYLRLYLSKKDINWAGAPFEVIVDLEDKDALNVYVNKAKEPTPAEEVAYEQLDVFLHDISARQRQKFEEDMQQAIFEKMQEDILNDKERMAHLKNKSALTFVSTLFNH